MHFTKKFFNFQRNFYCFLSNNLIKNSRFDCKLFFGNLKIFFGEKNTN